MTGALVLCGLLAAAAVVAVALPFLREPSVPDGGDVAGEPSPAARKRLELAEARDRTLGALQELEADHRAGRVSDEDYRASVGALRREAAQALRDLDAEERPA